MAMKSELDNYTNKHFWIQSFTDECSVHFDGLEYRGQSEDTF